MVGLLVVPALAGLIKFDIGQNGAVGAASPAAASFRSGLLTEVRGRIRGANGSDRLMPGASPSVLGAYRRSWNRLCYSG